MKFNFVQIAVVIVVVVLIVVALGIFTGIIPGLRGSQTVSGTVSVWLPQNYAYLETAAQDFAAENKNVAVTVKILPDSSYENEIINSLAAGTAPEVWLLPEHLILKHKDKIAAIPFSSYPERTFVDTFIDAGKLYMEKNAENGTGQILGLPVAVDPIVLYWNKDLLASSGLSQPPKTWDEFITHAQAATKLDAQGQIIRSGAALGSFNNIKNAKDLISLLILQSGNPIIDPATRKVALKDNAKLTINPTESAIRFFNDFANTRKVTYSWNRNLPDAFDAFVSQKLAMYFGFASENQKILRTNPHLNFDVAEVPQIKDAPLEATFGKMEAAVISKPAAKSAAAFQLIYYLSSYPAQKKIQNATLMPSVRRDVLAEPTDNIILDVFTRSAIKTKSWLDPDTEKTYGIFKNMVESTASGVDSLTGAVQNAQNQLQSAILGI
ncbi:MAG: extracellular solute-binding protein [Candidatus Niyogibacteria bacterium]|nr:extracellular solute-binding protein [Candidatus Niyogibacteria bacterium]